jgi:4-amino-4-deoxy-L-arabinose transferase-like glycosyltransferase/membrane-associated phospholipid phosphatase
VIADPGLSPSPHLTPAPRLNQAAAAVLDFPALSSLRFHAFWILAIILAWSADTALFHAMDRWYNGPRPINGEVHQIILSLAMFGQLLGIITAPALVLIFDPVGKRNAVLLIIVVLVAGLAATAGKALIGRARPLASGGETVIHGPTGAIRRADHQSFPSGHTTTAFAMALLLATMYPRAAGLVITLAVGVALNRIITCRHFLSDVVAGGWLGLTCAGWLMTRSWILKLADRLVTAIESGMVWPSRIAPAVVRSLHPRRLAASPWTLLAVALTINLAGNAATPLWDRDEPRFATATREMMLRGDWILPTFNGDIRPDKPVLIYWLMRGSYNLFGDNPFGARLVSAIAGALAPLVLVALGRKLFDPRTALAAGWMLALSPMLIAESKLATVDALLLLSILSGMYFLVDLVLDGRYRPEHAFRNRLGFWIAMAIGGLAKGPIALAVPLVSVVVFGLFQALNPGDRALTNSRVWRSLLKRALQPLLRMGWLTGLAVLAVTVGPWLIAVQIASDGAFLKMALGRHVIERSMVPMENHAGFPGFYVVSLIALMAPWSWLLPWAGFRLAEHWRRDERIRLLAAWSLGPLLMFELVRTKLVHYYLPAYPALLLLVSSSLLHRFGDSMVAAGFRLSRWFGWVALTIGGVSILGGLALVIPGARDGLLLAAAAVFIALGIAYLTCGGYILRGRRPQALVTLFAGLAVGYLTAGAHLMPAVGQRLLIGKAAARLDELRAEHPLALWQFRDPSLVWRLESVIKVVDPLRGGPELPESVEFARRHGRYLCPMTPKQVESLAGHPELRATVVETVADSGLFGLRQRPIHLVLVEPKDQVAERSEATSKR